MYGAINMWNIVQILCVCQKTSISSNEVFQNLSM